MATGFTQPWFPFTFNLPSGDVDLANWFSPRIDVSYAGTPAIERDVVENVASFGDQLGTLIDAVIELAGRRQRQEAERPARPQEGCRRGQVAPQARRQA